MSARTRKPQTSRSGGSLSLPHVANADGASPAVGFAARPPSGGRSSRVSRPGSQMSGKSLPKALMDPALLAQTVKAASDERPSRAWTATRHSRRGTTCWSG